MCVPFYRWKHRRCHKWWNSPFLTLIPGTSAAAYPERPQVTSQLHPPRKAAAAQGTCAGPVAPQANSSAWAACSATHCCSKWPGQCTNTHRPLLVTALGAARRQRTSNPSAWNVCCPAGRYLDTGKLPLELWAAGHPKWLPPTGCWKSVPRQESLDRTEA